MREVCKRRAVGDVAALDIASSSEEIHSTNGNMRCNVDDGIDFKCSTLTFEVNADGHAKLDMSSSAANGMRQYRNGTLGMILGFHHPQRCIWKEWVRLTASNLELKACACLVGSSFGWGRLSRCPAQPSRLCLWVDGAA